MNTYVPLDVSALATVPDVLREDRRFVCWREAVRDGKPTKIPVDPHTGHDAESDNPATWGTLDEAIAFYQSHRNTLHGIGRMFDPDDGIIGVDFDDCLDAAGNVIGTHIAAKWLTRFNSYSEVSPSGTGIKLWLRASHNLDGKTGRRDSKRGVEVYREKRYFTITGQRLTEFSANVEARQAEVAEFYNEVFSVRKSAANKPAARTPTTLTDAEIIRRAGEARNGAKFLALWVGNLDGYGSQSEADASLCGMLWFWTGDREAVERLFSQSALGQRDKWQRAAYRQSTLDLACNGEVYSPRTTITKPPADALAAAVSDARPKVRLQGDDRLLSDVASELGQHLHERDIYLRNDEVVILSGGQLRAVDAQAFRTWVETHVICYRQRTFNEAVYEVDVTMRDEEARGILASPQFKSALRVVRRINHARLPVIRADSKIELLPVGYDPASRTLTLPWVDYANDLLLADAVETVNDLLSEFPFTDQRSKAVAIAGMVSLYAAQLLPEKSLRPCFTFVANAEGAGKTLLVLCIVTPTLGEPPTGCKADEDDEVRKLLLTAVREARPVIFLDNLKGHLSSEALEAFLSAPTWSDRKLGVNETITADNLATVFITGNGLTVSPDMRRRSLFVELHQEAERAEDRQFRRALDVPTLFTLRPNLLAALWSLVRHWDATGRPAPSRNHSAFPSWAQIVGGIVEAAGWPCPLATANIAATADKDGDDMRSLVNAMVAADKEFPFAELAALASELELFEGVLDFDKDGVLKPKARSIFGRLLGRYNDRLVDDHRLVIAGKGHSRRYYLEAANVQGQQGQQGIPAEKGKAIRAGVQPKDLADLATLQPVSTNDSLRL